MVDYELEESPPSPAPTDDDYVGCFTDMVSDRVLTIVMTNEDLTPEVSLSDNLSFQVGVSSTGINDSMS